MDDFVLLLLVGASLFIAAWSDYKKNNRKDSAFLTSLGFLTILGGGGALIASA